MGHTMRLIVVSLAIAVCSFAQFTTASLARYCLDFVGSVSAGIAGYRSQCGHGLDADR